MDTAFPPSPQWHQPHSACLCCISEDEGWLLYSLNNSIHILNPFSLKYQGIMENGHTARINAIASRPLGNMDIVNHGDKSTQSVDSGCGADTHAQEITPLLSSCEINSSQCLPKLADHIDARKALVASVGDDLKVVCWDVTSRRAIASLKKIHQKAIKAVEWTNNGQNVVSASGSADQTIRIWDVEKKAFNNVIKVPELDKKLAPYQRSINWVPVAWTSKGQEILSCTSRGTMVRWSLDRDTGSFTKLAKGKVHNRMVYQVMVWPLGDFAFTISMDRKIITWDIENGQGVAQIECIGGNVYALDISVLDPGRIAMGLGNEAIKVWNTLSRDEPYESVTIERLQSRVRAIKWHPVDEGKICFGLESGKICMIEDVLGSAGNQPQKPGKKGNMAKNKISQKQTIFLSYHEGAIVSMAWCTPKVFEAPVPELFDLSLRDSTFCIVSCGSDGKILVTDSSKPTNKSLDLDVVLRRQNSAWYQSYQAIKGIEAPGRRDFAIHPSEELIAIGNDDGSVEVYELLYFKLVYAYQGHNKRVNRVKWNWSGADVNDGNEEAKVARYLLASGSDDGAIAIHRLDRFSAKALTARRQRERQAAAETQKSNIPAEIEGNASTSLSVTAEASAILPTRRVFAYFSYHNRGISNLAWSPHDSGKGIHAANYQKVVSVSYDGKAIVYELRLDNYHESAISVDHSAADSNFSEVESSKQVPENPITTQPGARQHKAIACFSPHEGQILSVHWSMSDVDRIYSGGNDWRICYWNWKSHRATDAQLEKLRRDGVSSDPQKAIKAPLPKAQHAPVKATSQVPPISPDDLFSSDDRQVGSGATDQTKVLLANSDGGSSEQQNDDQVMKRETAKDGASLPVKRGGEASLKNEPVISKRARTGRSNANTTSTQLSLGNTTPSSLSSSFATSTKYANLFPLSSAAFRFQTRERSHIEIIRLTRNLYCRRLGQGGVLMSEEDHVAARGRWRAMRAFFEKDGDEDGITISHILGNDVDEMNFNDNEDEKDMDTCDGLDRSRIHSVFQDRQPKRESEDMNKERSTQTDSSTIDTSVDDFAASHGDLVFYGSRESIKALAEMEAQEVVKNHSGSTQAQHHSNIFAVGSGLGVLPVSIYKHRGPSNETQSRKMAQLGQMPVNYWMGDISRMAEILSSLPEHELGIQDWIGIALSPMGGVSAWKEMMSRTAAKFERRGEIHAAALCYMGIGHVYEAVDAYRKQELYREALMLLRIRLWDEEDEEDDNILHAEDPETNGYGGDSHNTTKDFEQESKGGLQTTPASKTLTDLHIQILTEWGQYLERRGSFEQACKCQLTLAAVLRREMQRSNNVRSPSDKAEIIQTTPSVGLQTLARRGDIATLRTVAGIAILLQDPSQQERIVRYENALAHQRKPEQGS
ncbi:Gem-associated protein 5 [Mortierella sp. AM989]|nr:Gem-associated protein 5 [Mortierella sp. AM989]